jgi:hypothetical protein
MFTMTIKRALIVFAEALLISLIVLYLTAYFDLPFVREPEADCDRAPAPGGVPGRGGNGHRQH